MFRTRLVATLLALAWLPAAPPPAAAGVPDGAADQAQPPSPSPERRRPPDEKPGRQDLPISILPSGNRLVIVSDDPEALTLVQDLVRLMTRTTGSEGDV